MNLQETYDTLQQMVEKKSFSVEEYAQMRRDLLALKTAVDQIGYKMYNIDCAVEKQDWEAFISSLPVIPAFQPNLSNPTNASFSTVPSLSTVDGAHSEGEHSGEAGAGEHRGTVAGNDIDLDGLVWTWDMEDHIHGIPCQVYVHDEDVLYVFEGGHYLIGEPDLVKVPHCEQYEIPSTIPNKPRHSIPNINRAKPRYSPST